MKKMKEVSIYDLIRWDSSVNINIESLLNIWNDSTFYAWDDDKYIYITDNRVNLINDYIFKCEKEEAIKNIHELFENMGVYKILEN